MDLTKGMVPQMGLYDGRRLELYLETTSRV